MLCKFPLLHIVSATANNYSTDSTYSDLGDEEIINRTLIQTDHETLISNIRIYLTQEIAMMQPRSTEDERPRLRSIIRHRDNMVFWILRKRGRTCKVKQPSRNDFVNTHQQSPSKTSLMQPIKQFRSVLENMESTSRRKSRLISADSNFDNCLIGTLFVLHISLTPRTIISHGASV